MPNWDAFGQIDWNKTISNSKAKMLNNCPRSYEQCYIKKIKSPASVILQQGSLFGALCTGDEITNKDTYLLSQSHREIVRERYRLYRPFINRNALFEFPMLATIRGPYQIAGFIDSLETDLIIDFKFSTRPQTWADITHKYIRQGKIYSFGTGVMTVRFDVVNARTLDLQSFRFDFTKKDHDEIKEWLNSCIDELESPGWPAKRHQGCRFCYYKHDCPLF